MTRVFVTGIGVESCAGRSVPDFWDAVRTGRSGITALELDDGPVPGCEVAGRVLDFDPADTLARDQHRRLSRFQQLAVSAMIKALDWAELDAGADRSTAIAVGTSLAGLPMLEKYVRPAGAGLVLTDRLGPTKYLHHTAATAAAELLGAYGPSMTMSTACAASTDALAWAWNTLRRGDTRRALVCGTEAWISPLGLGGFVNLGAVTRAGRDEAAGASRPFDRRRDGVVPAEGAAALLLETEDAVAERGGEPLAEVLGAGSSCDAYHPLRPRPDGTEAAEAIRRALASAGLAPEEVDHVNAHGTATPQNDVVETMAIRQAFGAHADRLTVTATKSVVGHTLGACGALETVAAVLSITNGEVPPVANLDEPDPHCDLDYVAGRPRPGPVERVAKLSFGFGGENSVVVLGRPR